MTNNDTFKMTNYFTTCTYKGFEIEIKYKFPFIDGQVYETIKIPFEEGKIISWVKEDLESEFKKRELKNSLLKEIFKIVLNELEQYNINNIHFTFDCDSAFVHFESGEYEIETHFI